MLKYLVGDPKVDQVEEERGGCLGWWWKRGLTCQKLWAGKHSWWHWFYIPKKIMWGGKRCR